MTLYLENLSWFLKISLKEYYDRELYGKYRPADISLSSHEMFPDFGNVSLDTASSPEPQSAPISIPSPSNNTGMQLTFLIQPFLSDSLKSLSRFDVFVENRLIVGRFVTGFVAVARCIAALVFTIILGRDEEDE